MPDVASLATNLVLTIGDDLRLDVRRFSVRERLNEPFEIVLRVVHANPDLDFEALVGEAARFALVHRAERAWDGVVRSLRQVRTEPAGLTTYEIDIVSPLWLLSQRRGFRVTQTASEVEIAARVLDEWGIDCRVAVDPSAHPGREYLVQYAESDLAFVRRLLEDAGVTVLHDPESFGKSLVLTDAPTAAEPSLVLPFIDDPGMDPGGDYATSLTVSRDLGPSRYTISDRDHRRPPEALVYSANGEGSPNEARLVHHDHHPGAFLVAAPGGGTPSADDRGAVRTSEAAAQRLVERRIASTRGQLKRFDFVSNAMQLAPGMTIAIDGHPRSDLDPRSRLLVVETIIEGEATSTWAVRCVARDGTKPFRPPMSTPKPVVRGVETGTVVGPEGDEIHTDEFGRVRVQFHWDRHGEQDEQSSCWVPVSQAWAGAGYGAVNLPRIGQEVVVDFLGGNPDKPIVVGRIFTATQPVPYGLPQNKTQSGWKSNSTGGTGGYNEIMFEDQGGDELVRIQAERDLERVVKHDERDRVGNDRTREVAHDESLEVGNDRTRNVGHDETVRVENDRTRSVGHDERVTVGNDRTKTVVSDETRSIGKNRSTKIEKNDTNIINGERKTTIKESETLNVGKLRNTEVGLRDTLTVGTDRTTKVGGKDALNVSASQRVTIGNNRTATVGGTDMLAAENLVNTIATNFAAQVGDDISFTCGRGFECKLAEESAGVSLQVNGRFISLRFGVNQVTVSPDGISIFANKIEVTALDDTLIRGNKIAVSAHDETVIRGSKINLTSKPEERRRSKFDREDPVVPPAQPAPPAPPAPDEPVVLPPPLDSGGNVW